MNAHHRRPSRAAVIVARPRRVYGAPSGAGPARTPWGDPDYQGEWTSEGEYGVPFERPAQYGTRAVPHRRRSMRSGSRTSVFATSKDLERVDVLAGRVDAPNAPIPHWREYNTTSRRTSLIVDPPNGRFPPRVPGAKPWPVRQRCGTLAGGEPCDIYEDYGLGVRCIVHGGGVPDAMFPAVYNANMRIVQSPGYVAITYELIHDTRDHPDRPASRARPAPLVGPLVHGCVARALGRHDTRRRNRESEDHAARSTPALKLVERFTRTGTDAMTYQARSPIPPHGRRRGRWRSTCKCASGRCRRVRVRLPRRELRIAAHAGSVAHARCPAQVRASGRGPGGCAR